MESSRGKVWQWVLLLAGVLILVWLGASWRNSWFPFGTLATPQQTQQNALHSLTAPESPAAGSSTAAILEQLTPSPAAATSTAALNGLTPAPSAETGTTNTNNDTNSILNSLTAPKK